jgi:hypothetical protein
LTDSKMSLAGYSWLQKMHHYEQGKKYHHLTSAIPKLKYRLVIGNATWTHTIPANTGTYSTAALVLGNEATSQEQYVAEHKILLNNYNNYLGIEEVGKKLILYTAGDDALALLMKQYIGFGASMVLAIIDHLQWAIPKKTFTYKFQFLRSRYGM